jgi:hypothetical protein
LPELRPFSITRQRTPNLPPSEKAQSEPLPVTRLQPARGRAGCVVATRAAQPENIGHVEHPRAPLRPLEWRPIRWRAARRQRTARREIARWMISMRSSHVPLKTIARRSPAVAAARLAAGNRSFPALRVRR